VVRGEAKGNRASAACSPIEKKVREAAVARRRGEWRVERAEGVEWQV
jgi:hypothetical protein